MHTPVLLNETIKYLDPKEGDFVIDATVGAGGHSKEILKIIGLRGKLLGMDWDFEQIRRAEEILDGKLNEQVILIQGNYGDLKEIILRGKFRLADSVLVDLGFSSDQLDLSGRGFSFQKDEPLDMRFDAVGNSVTAMEVVNGSREDELAEIIWKYGEERFSRKIARAIIDRRHKERILTTFQLIEAIASAMPKTAIKNSKINFATRTFQALRIYVNQELENLERLLGSLGDILKPGGKVVIISFHSLEDRIVKNSFKGMAKEKRLEILTKKPVVAGAEEIIKNPRSRSAKLRAGKLTTGN